MPFQRLIQCDDCGGSFWFRVDRRSDPGPEVCELCRGTGNLPPMPADAAPFEAKAPAIRGVAGISGDAVYRAMEDSSAHRAELAADMLGVDKSETAHMKITNLNDRQRAGDSYQVPMTNVAHGMNDRARAMSFGGDGAGWAAMTQQGPAAGHWGDAARQGVVARHNQVAAAVQRAGQLNTGKEK